MALPSLEATVLSGAVDEVTRPQIFVVGHDAKLTAWQGRAIQYVKQSISCVLLPIARPAILLGLSRTQ